MTLPHSRGEGCWACRAGEPKWARQPGAGTVRARTFAVVAVGVLFGTLLVSVTVGVQPAAAYGPAYCSGYRWDVKTGQDPQASQVNLGSVTPTTVGYLTSLPAQPSLPDDYRLPPTELTQYEVTGTIVDYSLEHDNDYHVVIKDNSSSNVMITEIPDPACVPSSSPFAAMAANSRSVFAANAGIGHRVHRRHQGVRLLRQQHAHIERCAKQDRAASRAQHQLQSGESPTDELLHDETSPSSASVMQGQSAATLDQLPSHERFVAERHLERQRPSLRSHRFVQPQSDQLRPRLDYDHLDVVVDADRDLYRQHEGNGNLDDLYHVDESHGDRLAMTFHSAPVRTA